MMELTSASIKKNGDLFLETPHGVYTLTPAQVSQVLIDDNQMCEACYDTREIVTDVDDGEGHTMRGVGSERCKLHD